MANGGCQTGDVDPIDTDYDHSLALHYWIAQQRVADDSRDEPFATKRLDELFAQLDELLS